MKALQKAALSLVEKRLGLDKKEVVNKPKRKVESKVNKDELYELLKDIVR